MQVPASAAHAAAADASGAPSPDAPAPPAQLERAAFSSVDPLADERLIRSLERDLGPEVMALFADEHITEVGTNPFEELVWVESRKAGKKLLTDVHLSKSRVRSFLHRIADAKGTTITYGEPHLEAQLPPGSFKGGRLAGQLEPVVPAPCFTIRIPPSRPLELSVYLEQGAMTQHQYDVIIEAITKRWNIFVVGGTNSGKTTLAMAILQEVSRLCPDHRIVTIEDTPELQVRSWCWNPLYVHPTEGFHYDQLLRMALRMSPDRIVVGECRGKAIVQLFDALLSGHPGGLSTFHADTVRQAFLRMLNYARRDSDTDSHCYTIGDALDLIIVLKKEGGKRRITEMVRVHGYSDELRDYDLEPVG